VVKLASDVFKVSDHEGIRLASISSRDLAMVSYNPTTVNRLESSPHVSDLYIHLQNKFHHLGHCHDITIKSSSVLNPL